MKRFLSFLSFLIVVTYASAGTINIGGVSKTVDTLFYRQLGPGVEYTKLSLPDYPLSVYLMKIDMRNNYNRVENFQAQEHVGKTEAMTAAYNRLTTTSQKPLASVNGNFWIVAGQGQPAELLGVEHSGTVKNGVILTDPNGWNRGRTDDATQLLQEIGFAVIDTAKKVWIDDMAFDGKVTISGVGDYAISEINRIRKTNELVFFNEFLGQATRSNDDGIEVFIKPLADAKWSVNGDVQCEVTRIISDKGANTLLAGESVLSGNGTAKTFLQNLPVGQTLTVRMGIYTRLTQERPIVDQMVTGNALVMKNGELTIRNTNETYNSQLYPRTGIGMSQDGKMLYLIVIDKKGTSIGASTTTMSNILKAYGAWNVTSMDGGGSAQMMVKGAIVNNPADGQERPVANGWMVYHKTPVDNVISRLEFSDYQLKVPIYASLKPKLLGYNQYDVLVNDDIKGFSLSCTAGIGTIQSDTVFVGGVLAQNGLLTASYNGISVNKPISVINAKVGFRLDSVIVDSRRSYPVEVLSTVNGNTMSVAPESLIWTVQDPSVCSVENGVIRGLKNGKTLVIGSMNGIADTLKVNVQIPQSFSWVQDNFQETSGWTISSSSTSWNATFVSGNLPSNWNSGTSIQYTYKTARAPFIKLAKPLNLYSLPDTIKLTLNTGNVDLTKLVLSLSANNQTTDVTTTINSITKGVDTELSIPTSSVTDATDFASFPIKFNYLTLNINATTQVVDMVYSIYFKEIKLCYKGIVLGVSNPELLSKLVIYPNPVNKDAHVINFNNSKVQSIRYELFNQQGQIIDFKNLGTQSNGIIALPISNLQVGNYILKLYLGNKSETIKLLCK